MNKKLIRDYPLIEIGWFNPTYYRLRFSAPEIAVSCQPGQFINIRYSEFSEPLLRRPMSIFRRDKDQGWIEVLIKITGKGTLNFSKAKKGASFSILGPLGRAFSYKGIKRAILVGGGIGVAPLFFLAEEMRNMGIETTFLMGFKSANEACCMNEIEFLVKELLVTTDDGSYGIPGFVTGQLIQIFKGTDEAIKPHVFACGPRPMLRETACICEEFQLEAQFSLEENMACGFGACYGCAVPTSDRPQYRLVCVDGPIFNRREIDLEA